MNKKQLENAFLGHKASPLGKHKFHAVLIPFVERDGELYILYEVRAKDMDSDPGEVCFPGGHVEPGETYLECALRETEEELGIDPKSVEIVGQGDTLYGYANYTIFSYIGLISYETFQNIRVQKKEVDSVFLMKPEELKTIQAEWYEGEIVHIVPADFPYESLGIPKDYRWRKGRWSVPIFFREDDIIWGITGRFTDSVLNTLFP